MVRFRKGAEIMVYRDEIINFINQLLTPENFDDYCVNGLQVEGKAEIRKIALGVSASERLFQQAVRIGADMVIVHHGLFWKNSPHPMHLTGILYNRVRWLIQNEINFLGYHLPLDAHPEIGNNAQICNRLNLQLIEPVDVGFLSELANETSFPNFVKTVEEMLKTATFSLNYGAANVKKVLVISGGSSFDYLKAVEKRADTFLAGDIRENFVREIEEVRLNFINAGHYNTEKLGIQALGEKLAAQFSIPCEFIDVPNPI